MQVVWDIHEIQKQPSAVTIGFFDGLHKGHCFLLKQLTDVANERKLTSVVLTFWPHPREVLQKEYKPYLLNTLEEKLGFLEQKGVDVCVVLSFTETIAELSAFDFMKAILKENLDCSCLLIGYDHRFGKDRIDDFSDYERYGEKLKIEVLKMTPCIEHGMNVSSSLIRRFLSRGEIKQANHYLDYNYSITGTVTSGFENGRKIGFPTANIEPNSLKKMIPASGVYIVAVYLEEERYEGILNIGYRPTLKNGQDLSIEVHIFNFSGELYNEEVTVVFFERLRNEMKFGSLELLKKQLEKDKSAAIDYFSNHLLN